MEILKLHVFAMYGFNFRRAPRLQSIMYVYMK